LDDTAVKVVADAPALLHDRRASNLFAHPVELEGYRGLNRVRLDCVDFGTRERLRARQSAHR
jgi:hypothetical protein